MYSRPAAHLKGWGAGAGRRYKTSAGRAGPKSGRAETGHELGFVAALFFLKALKIIMTRSLPVPSFCITYRIVKFRKAEVHYYLSHCYTIAWDRIYDQLSLRVSARSLALCVCICSHSRSRNYERILTKFGTGADNRNGQDEFVSGGNRKMVKVRLSTKQLKNDPR